MAETYQIQYAMEAANDVRGLRAFDRRAILDAIEQHLRHAPSQESRSRIKRMTQPFWSQFRLRSDEFRVYYDVDEDKHVVSVLRVLFKGTDATPKEQP